MQAYGIIHLVVARAFRNPAALLIVLSAVSLGPGLKFIRKSSPVFDHGQIFASPWLLWLALAAASLSIWAVGESVSLQKSLPPAHLYLSYFAGIWTTSSTALFLASISIHVTGGDLPLSLLFLAPLKLAALGSLALRLSHNHSLVSIAICTALVLLVPDIMSPSLVNILGLPLTPSPIAQTASIVGWVLIGLGGTHSVSSKHALRRSR